MNHTVGRAFRHPVRGPEVRAGTFTPGAPGFVVLLMLVCLVVFSIKTRSQQRYTFADSLPSKYIPDRRIDNMGYWNRMARTGLVPVAPKRKIPKAVYRSSRITDACVASSDSPDIPVTETSSTQSENSVFVSPADHLSVLNSNNSSPDPYPGYFLGADAFMSADGGGTWTGQVEGAGGYNMGDPTTAINSNGRRFVGYIHAGGGQAISYSDDNGLSWHVKAVAAPPPGMGSILDKPHLWIDNNPSSPYKDRLYNAWTVFGGSESNEIQVSRSLDNGMAWYMPVRISDSTHARSHNQGVNLSTGPGGEVYAAWSVYDDFPGDEVALGFSASMNGGKNWSPARRILGNIRGIRLHGVNKVMRTNSFPSMAVDNSNSPWRGTIYIVWTNVNAPGVNMGSDVDVYLISSPDRGETWSAPVRINQDQPGKGKQHFFPWIACDPANGNLSVVFYDDRNCNPGDAETWVAASTDGGRHWQDFRISDYAFTPSPVTGLSDNYFGDYLGITALNGMVYPCWTDNRTGSAMSYVSPFRLGPEPGNPYIAYTSHLVNDTLGGNGNNRPDYGETISLSLTLRNMGNVADTGITARVTCDSPHVMFPDDTEDYGTFEAYGVITKVNAFRFTVSDSIPHDTRLVFTVKATDSRDSSYYSHFTMTVSAPGIAISGFTVDDPGGNQNHSLDPEEDALISARLTNTSPFVAEGVKSSLSSPMGFISISDTVISSGDLLPGEFTDITFPVRVHDIGYGSVAQFNLTCRYSQQTSAAVFSQKVGQISEDWETGDFSKFDWKESGVKPWKIDSLYPFEGRYCVKSGVIEDNEASVLSMDYVAATDDSISFYYRVSSEPQFDFLNFYIDSDNAGKWSGDTDWSRAVFPVTPGRHTFRWEYNKDLGTNFAMDAAWIDLVELPSLRFTTVDAGSDAVICAGKNFMTAPLVTYYDSLQWITSGSGYFRDPAMEVTSYFPSAPDVQHGEVRLCLKVWGKSYPGYISDTLQLSFIPNPAVFAGADTGVCYNRELRIGSATASGYRSVEWSTTGDGQFNDTSALRPVYSPGLADLARQAVQLVLKVYSDGIATCGFAYDTLTVDIYPQPDIHLPERMDRCAGYTADLDAASPAFRQYLWEPGYFRTPEIRVDTTGIGLGSAVFTLQVTDTSGCVTKDSVKVEFTNCTDKTRAGEVYFRVFPNPVKGLLTVELFSKERQVTDIYLESEKGERIVSITGREIRGQEMILLDIPEAAAGLYFLHTMNNGQGASVKVIVL